MPVLPDLLSLETHLDFLKRLSLAILIVMANPSLTGNCNLVMGCGKSEDSQRIRNRSNKAYIDLSG